MAANQIRALLLLFGYTKEARRNAIYPRVYDKIGHVTVFPIPCTASYADTCDTTPVKKAVVQL